MNNNQDYTFVSECPYCKRKYFNSSIDLTAKRMTVHLKIVHPDEISEIMGQHLLGIATTTVSDARD